MLQHHEPSPLPAPAAGPLPASVSGGPAALTAREQDVVLGLARGRAPKQLAADGAVSLATIRAHIQSAKRKTAARTLNELVAIAIRVGGPVTR